ncbi:Uma2 family endonuclease [Leptolyngbya sp. NIES-2104]|uniref:Uma2 family endonuclease n=1 Tax=Leptolyngbya sp. NIES-2104 TaxID=1552121 RepID=UPI0006EC98A9|nr:Uma2 family endonuclease [Leptolyngbya sp. NIES-2104]GAP97977.1 hypothetical protein NIES2104_45300 [Leptolyngbya sp. NIES-2104]
MTDLLQEHRAWTPGSRKLELIHGQLRVGDHATHSLRLLKQILRGWGMDAIVALAPERLWWQALSETFGAPPITGLDQWDEIAPLPAVTALQTWASTIDYTPSHPPHLGQWQWDDTHRRQALQLAFFELSRRPEKLGSSTGIGVVNRLGETGLMPDIVFYCGEPRNRLYDYYVEGAAEVVVEFLQPGCEEYVRTVKQPIYQAAGVPELWIVDLRQRHLQFLRLIDGSYQVQTPDADGCYAISSLPGVTFLVERLWQPDIQDLNPCAEPWFEVAADTPKRPKLTSVGEGLDWSKALLKFPVGLDPVPIRFEDYIYWCPPTKFELVNGQINIGGQDGIKGLAGMLMMTFGLREVVKLAHSQAWVQALVNSRTHAINPNHKAAVWHTAQTVATFLRHHYQCDRIAVAGDLIAPVPWSLWSEIVVVIWGLLPPNDEIDLNRYTAPEQVVQQLGGEYRMRLIDASRALTEAEQEVLAAGWIDL